MGLTPLHFPALPRPLRRRCAPAPRQGVAGWGRRTHQIPPSRLVQRISPATGSVVGLFFPLRPPVRASGGSPPLGPTAPIG